MRIGIIGAKGLIGSYLTEYFLARNCVPLRVLIRGSSVSGGESGVEVVEGDLISPQDCERFASGLDVIYYLAHKNTPVNSDRDPPSDALVNLVPLLTFLQAVQSLGSKPHIVYFSTGGAMYAPNPDRVPFRETDPIAPFCSYGIQKLAAEQYLRVSAERGIFTATVLRVGNAYGTLLPQHRMQGLIGVAIGNVAHGRPIRIFGDQDNVRDYVHLRDVCSMALLAAQPRDCFTVVNVSYGQGHSVREILSVIAACHQRPLRIQAAAEAACSSRLPEWVVLNIDKARSEFGWTPEIGIQNGIAEMLSRHLAATLSRAAIAI